MSAYYNEHDEFAAEWLRNLIKAGLIADGEVDTRSIVDVRPGDLVAFEQCHFFAGIGGWSYALRRAGWDDSAPVWTGSCPCQPFSLAGAQKGFDDERHLWPEFRRLIAECNPPVVFGEQVASAAEWLGLVRGDLEALGYAVGAIPVQAASAGADHLRDRYWFVADSGHSTRAPSQPRTCCETKGGGEENDNPTKRDCVVAYASVQRGEAGLSGSIAGNEGFAGIIDHGCGEIHVADSSGDGLYLEQGKSGIQEGAREWRDQSADGSGLEWVIGADGKARRVKPGIRLLAHGVPNRVGLLRGFGNAIDPRPAAAFIGAYMTVSDTSRKVTMSDWQDISTAPKDGSKVDLWHPTKGRVENAFWQSQTYALYEPWGWSNPWWGRITGATHWMPLPQSPQDLETDNG